MTATLEVEVGLEETEPRRAAERFEEFAQSHDLPMGVVFKFQLALDELLTNVVSYAFDDDAVDPVIALRVELRDDRIEATLRDNGRGFNPLVDAPAPDLDLSAEERPVGGLGIYLTKAFVHSLDYARVDGWNTVHLAQPLEAEPKEKR